MAMLAPIPATSRRIKSLRIRTGRSTSARSERQDETIPLDLSQDPNEILKEILTNVCAKQRVSTERKLGHLNNFVKLFCSTYDDSAITIPIDIIMTCLKPTLVSEVKEVRAAGIRALRYLINDQHGKQTFIDLNLDNLVTKCLDISHFNEVERIQAIRLVRKIAHLKQSTSEAIVPMSLASCLVSVSLGGAEERDRVYRTSLAVLCELALLQPWLVVRCNGVLALINAVMECHLYQRINECLCLSLMHIINHPDIRHWHPTELDMSAIFAPYTELNYRFHPDVDDSKLKDELGMRFTASRMAIVSLLRTWDGLFHITHSKDMLTSFIDAMLVPNDSVRRGIFMVICELFYFNEPIWTDDFNAALKAAASGSFRDTWRHSEGFVVAETKSLIPIGSSSRPDLVNSHLAILLSAFLQCGLMQALSSVAVSSDAQSAIAATIILGSLLHLSVQLLPHIDDSKPLLPDLLKETGNNLEENLQINLAVKRLQEVHHMLSAKPTPYSVYLSHILFTMRQPNKHHNPSGTRTQPIGTSDPPSSFTLLRRNRSLNIMRDYPEEQTLLALKNTKVLNTKEKGDWDWGALGALLLSPPSPTLLHNVGGDETVRRFFRRLIYFYLPASKLFSALDLVKDGAQDHNQIYVVTACHMVQFLSNSDDEGQRLLRNLIEDILAFLPKTNSEAGGYNRSIGSLGVTCARDYYLILGSLSGHVQGEQILQQCKVYHYYQELACETTHESLIKLMISGLSYTMDGQARAVFSKVLKTCNEASRLYATGFLRVLLRTNCPAFHHWGAELLTTQLFDKSNEVTTEAIDILHEACDNKHYLRSVVRLRPTLLHLGDRGSLLVCRFLSDPKGFDYLTQNHYLTRELDRWRSMYNEKYVLHVEELLKLSMTTFERANKEDGFVRRSGNRKFRQSVHLPAHLYGELCKHERGAKILRDSGVCNELVDMLSQYVKSLSHGKDSTSRNKDSMTHGKDSMSHNKDSTSHGKDSTSHTSPTKDEIFSNDNTHDRTEDDHGLLSSISQNNNNRKDHLLKVKSWLWALAHIGSTIWGFPLLKDSGGIPLMRQLARQSKQASIKGTCIYCLCTIAQTIPGVEVLRQAGWESVLNTVNTLDDEREIPITPAPPICTPHLRRNHSVKKSMSIVSQKSNLSLSSNSKSNRISPDGSTSNLSISSELSPTSSTNEEPVKPRSLSRNSSSKSRRSKKKSTSHDDHNSHSFVTSPITSFNQSNASDTFTTIISPMSTSSDAGSFDTSATSVRSSKHGSDSKPRIKDRFLEFFTKRNRSKSLAYGSLLGLHHKHNRDDSSSGYVSDHLATNDHLVMEDYRGNHKEQPPEAANTNHAGRSSMTSSNKVDIMIQNEAQITNGRRSVEQHEKETKPLLWNTNNSGQVGSTLHDQETTGNTEKVDRIRPKHSRSLPDMLDVVETKREIPNTLNLHRKSKKETLNFLGNHKIAEKTVPLINVPPKLDSPLKTAARVNGSHTLPRENRSPVFLPHYNKVETKECALLQNDSIILGHSKNISDASEKLSSDASGKFFSDANEIFPSDASKKLPSENLSSGKLSDSSGNVPSDARDKVDLKRLRGNTQNSVDSGVILDSLSSPVRLANYDIIVHHDPTMASVPNTEWRIARPKHGFKPPLLPGTHTQTGGDSISYDEQQEIIRFTRYVGIVVPTDVKLFLQGSSDNEAKSKKSKQSLVTLYESMTQDSEDLGEGPNKPTRHKFRGLDGYGPAHTLVMTKQTKSVRSNQSNASFARTPDSLLSESSGLCFIGGQAVDPDSDEFVQLFHEEILQLVVNLGSSVGVKTHETSLLLLKEKRFEIFDSLSLYNRVVAVMSEYSFRLSTRRFVQELFQDVPFTEVYEEAQRALKSIQ